MRASDRPWRVTGAAKRSSGRYGLPRRCTPRNDGVGGWVWRLAPCDDGSVRHCEGESSQRNPIPSAGHRYLHTMFLPSVMLLPVKNGTGENPKLFRGMMFEGFGHGEEHEEAIEQGGHGDGTGSLHLAPRQARGRKCAWRAQTRCSKNWGWFQVYSSLT